jgi:hypothetical protein
VSARVLSVALPKISSAFIASGREVPTGALYTCVLLLHVACAVVGFGAMVITGIQAGRARHGPTSAHAQAVRRYFGPGVNWAARAIYLVPVFGFALLGASGGKFDASDSFVLAGLGLWGAAAVVAETVLWPAERRIQRVVRGDWRPGEALGGDCRRVVGAAWFLVLVFAGATLVMFARP